MKNKAKKSNRIFALMTLALTLLGFTAAAVYVLKDRENQANTAPAADSSVLVKPHNLVKGPQNAPVTVVEFLDPECESCRAMHPILKQIEIDYGDQLRIVTRYLPLHPNARYASAALEEAREHGKYDEAIDILFHHQPIWASHHHPRPELIVDYLSQIGIKKELLSAEYLLPKHGWKIDLDEADARKLGARLTPTFFVNGRVLLEIGYGPLKEAIDLELSRIKSD